jgi:hypothetical protein
MKLLSYTEFDIKKEYDYLNKHQFNGILPKIKLGWNNQIRTGGIVNAEFNKKLDKIKSSSIELCLSKRFQRTYDGWVNILLHEMIHVRVMLYDDCKEIHGFFFNQWMNRVNKNGYHVALDDIQKDRKITQKKEIGAILYEGNNEYYVSAVHKEKLEDWYLILLRKLKLLKKDFKTIYFMITDDSELIYFPVKYTLNELNSLEINKELFKKLLKENKILYKLKTN